jgi:hypothetical protein
MIRKEQHHLLLTLIHLVSPLRDKPACYWLYFKVKADIISTLLCVNIIRVASAIEDAYPYPSGRPHYARMALCTLAGSLISPLYKATA